MIDIIIAIVCAMGAIACAVNATKVSGMLLWSFIGALELIGTILKVMEIFA